VRDNLITETLVWRGRYKCGATPTMARTIKRLTTRRGRRRAKALCAQELQCRHG
jgi:hypothetical protein